MVNFNWAGRSWRTRDTGVAAQDPGPNVYKDANVSVDANGFLRMRIASGSPFTTSQIYLNGTKLGYGTYRLDVQTSLMDMDKNVVLGFFTYENNPANGYSNLVMEASKFGQATRAEDLQVSTAATAVSTFTKLRPGASQLVFTWRPGLARFRVHDSTGATYFVWDSDENVPLSNLETLGVNFWLSEGQAPADGLGREVVITNFTYTEPRMGFQTVQLGRLALTEYFDVDEQSGSDRSLSMAGQESSQFTGSDTATRQRGADLLALDGYTVNVLFTTKTDRNGFYRIKNPSVTFTTYQGQSTIANWEVTLERLGDTSEVEFESRLIGGARISAYPALTAERWHAPPIGHGYYYAGTTTPSFMTRVGADGAYTIYRNVALAASPRWGITPSDYLRGAPTITVGGRVVPGLEAPNLSTDWAISNGLIKVEARTTTGTVRVSAWNPATGAWFTAKVFDVKMGTTSMGAFTYITVLRNDPEECVIRLTRTINPGRALLDISIKRGSRFAAFFAQRREAGKINVAPQVAEASTDSGAGYVYATANDASGNQFVTGMPVLATVTPATGAIENNATVLAVPFFIGLAVGGTAAVSGDAPVDIAKQYLGTPAEETRVVRR